MSLEDKNEVFEDSEDKQIEHVKKVKKKITFKLVSIIIIVIIIIGLISHLILVYFATQTLEIKEKQFDKIEQLSLTNYEVTFTLTFQNPTDTEIDINKLTYDVYLEDEYLGNGEKSSFAIQPGLKEHAFSLQFNIFDLPAVVRELFLHSTATLKIVGEVTIPAKFFGLWEFTAIKNSYEITEDVSASSL